MKKSFKVVLIIGICNIMLLSILLWPCLSPAVEMRGVTDTTIKLGLLSDFTGTTAATGRAIANG
jgi:hypothetical protein